MEDLAGGRTWMGPADAERSRPGTADTGYTLNSGQDRSNRGALRRWRNAHLIVPGPNRRRAAGWPLCGKPDKIARFPQTGLAPRAPARSLVLTGRFALPSQVRIL
ncbi:hypothetical protein STUTZSP0542_31030 [Stutzerimonas marianensis]